MPLAAEVLAPVGFVLPMSIGAILMSLSTIIVVANAQLLRRLDLTQTPSPALGAKVARMRSRSANPSRAAELRTYGELRPATAQTAELRTLSVDGADIGRL